MRIIVPLVLAVIAWGTFVYIVWHWFLAPGVAP